MKELKNIQGVLNCDNFQFMKYMRVGQNDLCGKQCQISLEKQPFYFWKVLKCQQTNLFIH